MSERSLKKKRRKQLNKTFPVWPYKCAKSTDSNECRISENMDVRKHVGC